MCGCPNGSEPNQAACAIAPRITSYVPIALLIFSTLSDLSYLQASDQVSGLKEGEGGDLVDDSRDLWVRWGGSLRVPSSLCDKDGSSWGGGADGADGDTGERHYGRCGGGR